MKYRSSGVALAMSVMLVANVARGAMTFCCSGENDLFKIVGGSARRFDAPAEAIDAAENGSAVLILADGYPQKQTDVSVDAIKRAKAKKLRLFIECPDKIEGFELAPPRLTTWERGVVASDFFGPVLPKLRIVELHDCHYLPATTTQPMHLAIARVAGYDTAVYGLGRDASPLLFETSNGWLIATTKLSGFVTARFAPAAEWKHIWQTILQKLDPSDPPPELKYEPIVRPALSKDAPLPDHFERATFDRAASFYHRARLLITQQRRGEIHRLTLAGADADPPPDDVEGDGSLGMIEGYASHIRFDGSQTQRTSIRADCNAETAMVLSLDSSLNLDHENSRKIAANLFDYVFGPEMQSMGRLDPKHPAFGLIAWGAIAPAWMIGNYGDDDARVILATILASAAQKTQRWDEPILRALLANLRTTGTNGFRGDRVDIGPLEQRGWKHFHDAPTVNFSPHFESYLWACNLWAFARTGDREFLNRTTNAIRMTMDAYAKKQWRWMDNLERAHMLLCLSWLVRIEDTSEHRQWLSTLANDLLAAQQPCGAIQERRGDAGLRAGHFQVPQSNEAYGTNETPLIQNVGDPASDQLYTTGFALLGLHEAASATGDAKLKAAEDKLTEFLCRIQVRSEKVPYIDGGWFRAFDYQRWDYWASSADAGWGVWCVEAGWGQAWIAATLALREKRTTLWDMTASSQVKSQMTKVRELMAQNDGSPLKK